MGASPAVLDAALSAADRHDIQLALHADGLGESATLEETLAAIDGRAVHAYHVEGCGGGPVNLLELVAHQHVLPSSTAPTVPFGENVVAEHEPMIRTVHRLSGLFANDIRAAGGRVRAWTIAAESVLHDLGAISMMSSDSMGMGRIGEVTRRTWQLAHLMESVAPSAEGDGNERILRYLAKLTINPARVHGVAHELGSLSPGKIADVVALAAGVLCRQAGAGAQGRVPGVGAARVREREHADVRADRRRRVVGEPGQRSPAPHDRVRRRRRSGGRSFALGRPGRGGQGHPHSAQARPRAQRGHARRGRRRSASARSGSMARRSRCPRPASCP